MPSDSAEVGATHENTAIQGASLRLSIALTQPNSLEIPSDCCGAEFTSFDDNVCCLRNLVATRTLQVDKIHGS